MDGDASPSRRRWLVISPVILAAASLAGCGAGGGTATAPAASMLAGSGQHAQCVTSDAKGSCGPYEDPSVGIADGKITVGQDVWNPISGWSQTLHATSPGNWYVTANMPVGNTGVISFPNVGETYASNTLLSNFSSIYSSFSEDMHAISATSAWAAYDIWLNNWGNEVMIQNDFANNGACAVVATVKFGGSGGVPVQTWNLCKYGTEIIWKLKGGNEQSGAVDILAMLNWLVSNRYLPEKTGLTAISYGWEVCSTGGKPETFTMSRFTVTAS